MENNEATPSKRSFFSMLKIENWAIKVVMAGIGLFLFLMLTFTILWGSEPDSFDVKEAAQQRAAESQQKIVTGYYTVATAVELIDVVLHKSGGYLSNDRSPFVPGGFYLDNVPHWEEGVINQVRDLTRALRNHISRSQTQSTEDEDLKIAQEKIFFSMDSWIIPMTESEYADSQKHLLRYLARLSDSNNPKAQFYARADNLSDWFMEVETRLGSLSQRLSASVGKRQINTDLAGDSAASQSTNTPDEVLIKTPYFEIDDVFYEARGSSWALLHILRAIELDFADVLEKKNALISLRQIIRELEPTQSPIIPPMILNGEGFGFQANHSLVMASYIARVNAALIDLRQLLQQG